MIIYWYDGAYRYSFLFNKEEEERSKFYTISNIKRVLDALDVSLFADFLKIMVFDALLVNKIGMKKTGVFELLINIMKSLLYMIMDVVY